MVQGIKVKWTRAQPYPGKSVLAFGHNMARIKGKLNKVLSMDET